MTKINQRWLVVAGVCLLLWPAVAFAQQTTDWETAMAAGREALQGGV